MNKKGMSLVEILVAVGIIAVLAAIAVPSYDVYLGRARRAEGLNLLNAYYAAAMGVKGEFGRFPGNFVQTDFAPTGVLNYRFQVIDGNDIGIPLIDDNCVTTAAAADCDCGGACAGFKTWSEPAILGAVGASVGPIDESGAGCGLVAPMATTDISFSVRATSVINTRAATRDEIGMNELKQIQVCLDGTK